MKIEMQHFKEAVVVKIEGRIGIPVAYTLQDIFRGLIERGYKNIVLDLSGEVTLHSPGFRVVLKALKECRKEGGDIRIANPSQRVRELLRMGGLDEIFLLFEDEASAVGSF